MERWKRGICGVRQMEIDEFAKAEKKHYVDGKIKKLTYPQDWESYNEAQTKEKIICEKLLLELLDSIPDQEIFSKRGGRPWTPIRQRVYCMFLYAYSGYSSRRCISDLQMAKDRGIIPKVPHFNSILNFYSSKNITTLLMKLIWMTSLPLRHVEESFAIDSSGFSTSLFERWFNIRTQLPEKKRHWKKAHLCIGVKTNVITSIEITDGTEADSPELIRLVEQTGENFDIKAVSADKAYLSRQNFDRIAEMGAIPYIPFKSNSTRRSKGSVIWSRMFDFFLQNRETFDKGYHQRSNIETTFHMIKRKFGNGLKTRKDDSQVNEILMKCLCHNLAVLVQESIKLGLEVDLGYCAAKILAQQPR